MTIVTGVSLSDLSRFRHTAPAADVGRLTLFLAPGTAADHVLAPRDSDRGEQAMHRLRHPFEAERQGPRTER